MKRRTFIAGLGSAAAWPVVAWGQQSTIVRIGFLWGGLQAPALHLIALVRQSLAEAGFVDGRNLTMEFRFAEGKYDRLTSMAVELVHNAVSLIVCIPTPAALAAKEATSTIPIVFGVPETVKYGLVKSLAQPGGNATGVSFLLGELGAKQLGFLRTLLPKAKRFALLINPNNENAAAIPSDMKAIAAQMNVDMDAVEARDSREIEAAFAKFERDRVDALVVGTDIFFFSRRLQIATLATRHNLPAIYNAREYADAGGLMTYGTDLTEVYRQVGAYAGRILKGEGPANLPVVQSSKFEFVINLPTARALGLEVPPNFLARADGVIE